MYSFLYYPANNFKTEKYALIRVELNHRTPVNDLQNLFFAEFYQIHLSMILFIVEEESRKELKVRVIAFVSEVAQRACCSLSTT